MADFKHSLLGERTAEVAEHFFPELDGEQKAQVALALRLGELSKIIWRIIGCTALGTVCGLIMTLSISSIKHHPGHPTFISLLGMVVSCAGSAFCLFYLVFLFVYLFPWLIMGKATGRFVVRTWQAIFDGPLAWPASILLAALYFVLLTLPIYGLVVTSGNLDSGAAVTTFAFSVIGCMIMCGVTIVLVLFVIDRTFIEPCIVRHRPIVQPQCEQGMP
jgi:hypothetical protein